MKSDRVINARIWSDSKFRSLPVLQKLILIHTLTKDGAGYIHGVRVVSPHEIAMDFADGCTERSITKALVSLRSAGIIEWEESTGLVWLVNSFKWKLPANGSVAISWAERITLFPEGKLQIKIAEKLLEILESFLKEKGSESKDSEKYESAIAILSDHLHRASHSADTVAAPCAHDAPTTRDHILNRNYYLSEKSDTDSQERHEGADCGITPSRIMDLWNTITSPELSKIHKMTKTRADKFRRRVSEGHSSEEVWISVFKRFKEDKYFQGSNNINWSASFDWLVKNDTNIVKIIEGKLGTKEPIAKQDTGAERLRQAAERDEARRKQEKQEYEKLREEQLKYDKEELSGARESSDWGMHPFGG